MTDSDICLSFPLLLQGILLRRYKRFFADIQLPGGEIVIAHCPNTGRMTECSEPGQTVWVHYSNNSKRQLKYDWFLIDMPDSLVGIRTLIPNELIALAAQNGKLHSFESYTHVKREVFISPHTRIDFLLQTKTGMKAYIEVKNCSWVEDKIAYFPDAITLRGQKHLETLTKITKKGNRAALIIVIQRMDAKFFKPAGQIDTIYDTLFQTAKKSGVEILVYDTLITPQKICLGKLLPIL